MATGPPSTMPQKIYSLYHNIEDFTFSMPGGWDDYTISVFIEACHKYVDDLRNYGSDFMRQWSRIVGYGLAATSNISCFNITVTMELAKVLKAYLLKNENTNEYVRNEAFKNLLDDTKYLLAYFPNANESQICAPQHPKKCNCLPSDKNEPTSIIHVINQVSKQYRHLFGVKGIPASILWSEMNQKVTDKTGVKVDVKQFLEPIKIDIAIKVKKEIDNELKIKKFLTLAKDYLPYFDYIPPRNIKKSDFLPPDLIMDDDNNACKNDNADANEDTESNNAGGINQDFVDVDYVGAYCEVPYSEEIKSTNNSSTNNDATEENVASVQDSLRLENIRDEQAVYNFSEAVRVEKCESSLYKNFTGFTDNDCLLGEEDSLPDVSAPDDDDETFNSSEILNTLDSFENSYRIENSDQVNMLDHHAYSSMIKKYPDNTNEYPKVVENVPARNTTVCKYPINAVDTTFSRNEDQTDLYEVLNSVNLIPKNPEPMPFKEHDKFAAYSSACSSIRDMDNACEEREALIEPSSEILYTNNNLSYEQTAGNKSSFTYFTQESNPEQILNPPAINELRDQSSNSICKLYDGAKFCEDLLSDTVVEVYDFEGSETDDRFSTSADSPQKITGSLENLISSSRTSSPLTVSDSLENLLIEDINSNDICDDDGLFKRTVPEIQETYSNALDDPYQENLQVNDTFIENTSTDNVQKDFEQIINCESETQSNNVPQKLYSLKRAKSVDSIFIECRKHQDCDLLKKTFIKFLNELKEIFIKSRKEKEKHFEKSDEPEIEKSVSSKHQHVEDKRQSQKSQVVTSMGTALVSVKDKVNSIEQICSHETNNNNDSCDILNKALVLPKTCIESGQGSTRKILVKEKLDQRKRRLIEQINTKSVCLLKNRKLLNKEVILFYKFCTLRKQYVNEVKQLSLKVAKLKKKLGKDEAKQGKAEADYSKESNCSNDGQDIQASDSVQEISADTTETTNNILATSTLKDISQKRIREDDSSSDDSDTPFYGFKTCNPTKKFKKRKSTPLNFSRSDNVGPVLIGNQLIKLKKAAIVMKDFVTQAALALETDPKRHVCLCDCAKKLEEEKRNASKSTDSDKPSGSNESVKQNSDGGLSDEQPNKECSNLVLIADSNRLHHNDIVNSLVGVISHNNNKNTLKPLKKDYKKSALSNQRIIASLGDAIDDLEHFRYYELSASQALKDLIKNYHEFEFGFETHFLSAVNHAYRTNARYYWYNKFVDEYRNHMAWKAHLKWKMEIEMQALERNKIQAMDKLLILLPKNNRE